MSERSLKDPDILALDLEHMEITKKIAGECAVLLENNGCLPLRETGKIALYGNGARHMACSGTGSGDCPSRVIISFEDGLEQAGFEIKTKNWLNRFDLKREQALKTYEISSKTLAEKMQMPLNMVQLYHPFVEPEPEEITKEDIDQSNSDTCIYVLSRISGEGADRSDKEGDYRLYASEKANLLLLGATYKRVIVVLNIGAVMDMTELKRIPGIGAILLISQLGNIGGAILPEILSGSITPSGKLTDTWAASYRDYPSSKSFGHNNGNLDDEEYTEGIYVGYRYFDSFGVKPTYCFGYGKSYTEFQLTDAVLTVSGTLAVVEADVTNIGRNFSGKEVVQVYVSKPQSGLDKAYQDLAAYQKTKELRPGETEHVKMTFQIQECASYSSERGAYILETGVYKVRIGTDSRSTRIIGSFMLNREVITRKCKNLFQPDRSFEELKPATPVMNPESAGISVHADCFVPDICVYTEKRTLLHTDKTKMLTAEDINNGYCKVEELVAQLSLDELSQLCVGTAGWTQKREASVVGDSSNHVRGAAGDSSSVLYQKRGVRNLVMADGPAGLRLQTHYTTKENGRDVDHYQYCTSLPVGWAIAQSWNQELAELAGEIAGKEMELFSVDLWLAPAMNIHRDPLCGRNFEYYSEDPLVSGKTAAAVIRGVQKHRGRGAVIKHFAANNQESNRYFTNVHISERTIREIYLKGFEIAITEGHPKAVMTSYNLINGIHAANSRDLLQHVLRDEWGFEGLVMTDWFSTQDVPSITGKEHSPIYPIASSVGAVYAGNDLQMPGCEKNIEDLIEAVTEEKETDGFFISKADLQFCAANIIRAAVQAH